MARLLLASKYECLDIRKSGLKLPSLYFAGKKSNKLHQEELLTARK